jgi:hypothetical protein
MARWILDTDHRRRVLRGSGDSFDEAQANAWRQVKELHDAERLSSPETPNGPGSTLALTERLRPWLAGLLRLYGIRTMLDAPCGDLTWMQFIDLEWVEYTGWDLVPELIERCRRRAPESSFDCVNLLTVSVVPCVDLILCRDFLAHLPNEPAQRVLNKFKASGSRYLLASHYPGTDNDFDYKPAAASFGYAERPINLEAAPFSLGDKLAACTETLGPTGVISQPHELALFQLS